MKQNLDFGTAIKAMKNGSFISREGWNGKGMYLLFHNGGSFIPMNEKLEDACNKEGKENAYVEAYILMKNAQGTFSVWNPSIMDIFAEDWCILD